MSKLQTLLRTFVPFAFLVLAALPLSAQDYDGSIGYGMGGIWFSDFNSGGGGAQLALDPGWVVVGHIDQWVNRGRFGGRVNVAFTQRPLDLLDDSRAINTWIVGGDLLLRILPATPGRAFAPFIAGGAGVAMYGLGEGPSLRLDRHEARYPGDNDRRFTVSGGVGFDILPDFTILGTPSGFRIEVIDHVALESPFVGLSGASFDPVHNFRVSFQLLGLVRLLP